MTSIRYAKHNLSVSKQAIVLPVYQSRGRLHQARIQRASIQNIFWSDRSGARSNLSLALQKQALLGSYYRTYLMQFRTAPGETAG